MFEARLARARAALGERNLPALLVYTDVWRSNQARFLTNFMPYWNRSLVVIPREAAPVLLCALSPRVYPWIKSVTVFEDIRPASKLMQTLDQLCAERQWRKLGVLDLPMLPVEIHSRLREIGSRWMFRPLGFASPMTPNFPCGGAPWCSAQGGARKAMWLKSAQFEIGTLERHFRQLGAEDLVIRVRSRGSDAYSVSMALEYCGHWVKVTRANGPADEVAMLEQLFYAALANGGGHSENLAGPQPYEPGTGPIFALHVEHKGLYFGDTCTGTEPL